MIALLFALVACDAETPQVAEAPAATEEAPAEKPVAEAKAAEEANPHRGDDAEWKHFGKPFAVASAIGLDEALANPETAKPVRVTGELTQVCQKMGCWAVVRGESGEQTVRISMKDHAFGIDKDTAGKACDVEGMLVLQDVDPKAVAHYKSEGAEGKQPEDGKTKVYALTASSVSVARK